MRDEWPARGSKVYEILQTVNELSAQCFEGRVPITEIHLKLGKGGRESIRVMLSQLKRNGYVDTPVRGMYVLTEKGKKLLAGGRDQ